jgi:hypothetical protein
LKWQHGNLLWKLKERAFFIYINPTDFDGVGRMRHLYSPDGCTFHYCKLALTLLTSHERKNHTLEAPEPEPRTLQAIYKYPVNAKFGSNWLKNWLFNLNTFLDLTVESLRWQIYACIYVPSQACMHMCLPPPPPHTYIYTHTILLCYIQN